MSNITINEGTAKVVKTRTVASEEVQAIYLNVGTAADNPFTGTVLEVSKLATGTVSVNTPGTITSGSIAVTAGTGIITSGSIVVTAGTVTTTMGDISGGTIDEITNGSIVVTNGTVKVTTPGTITSGSIAITDGTVKVVTPGTITSGSIAVTAGTITSGSIVVTDGTVKVTTPGTITSGSIAVTAATVTSGSVAITSGTVGGKAASGAAAVANPVQIAGTDSGGTIYSPLITTTGAIGSIQNIGTIKEAGTVTGVGVVTTLTNLSNGTIQNSGTTTGVGTVSGIAVVTTVTNLSNGTIQNSGTTTGVGTITNIGTIKEAGTVTGVGVVTTLTNLSNGTIQSSGTSTGVGVVSNLTQGSINVTAGTVGGKAASGAAAVANPVQIAGTDSGGTIYSPLVTTGGAFGSITGMGVVTTLSNLTNGTVRVTAGTVNAGTINAGTINTGTINEGTLSLITTVSNLTNGSIKVTAGTGIVTASTVNTGTINSATINAATINTGTIRDDGRAAVNFLTFGTTFGGTGTAAAYATLVAAPGANTSVWVSDLSLTNPYGTLELAIGFGTAVDGTANLVKGVYGTQTGVGIQKTFPKAVNGGITNTPLIVSKSGLGTVYANVSYFTSA